MSQLKLPKLKKTHLYIIAAASVLVALAVYGTYYWWIGTPQYSLIQLRTAVREHDVNKAFSYIDYDRIFENAWEELKAQLILEQAKDTSADDPFAALGTMLGMGLLENMQPAMKAAGREGFEKIIQGTNEPSGVATTSSGRLFEAVQ